MECGSQMAQLIKLQDYISRYQIDLNRYPTQFVRLKRVQWESVKEQFEHGGPEQQWDAIHIQDDEEKEKPSFFQRLFGKKKQQALEETLNIEELSVESELDEEDKIPDEATTLHFEPRMVFEPKNMEELKRMYLDQFFHFQLKWASSTLLEKSYVDPRYLRDTLLRVFTQSLPDSYFLLYFPIFQVKKAPIEVDIVLITPTEILCITPIEQQDLAVYVADGDRFWTQKIDKVSKRVLSPLIQLNRMESIVASLMRQHEVDLPIRKVVLSRNGFIDYPGTSYSTQFIDQRKFEEWFLQLKRSKSPMKHMQIKAASVILEHTQTTSFQRDLWKNDAEAVEQAVEQELQQAEPMERKSE